MYSPPFVVSTILERHAVARTLVDNGCLSYGAISEKFARKQGLPTFNIALRPMRGVGGQGTIRQIVRSSLAIGNHFNRTAFFYVIPDHLGYDLILGLPWLKYHDARLELARGRLYLRSLRTRVRSENVKAYPQLDITTISASAM